MCHETSHCLHIHKFSKNMEGFLVIMYYDGDIILTYEGFLWQYNVLMVQIFLKRRHDNCCFNEKKRVLDVDLNYILSKCCLEF